MINGVLGVLILIYTETKILSHKGNFLKKDPSYSYLTDALPNTKVGC